MEAETVKKEYQGANVRRWREWRNMNQDVLADLIGVSQATMSGIERKTNIDTETVEKIAKALDIPVEAITELSKENLVNIYTGNWHDNSSASGQQNANTMNIAPTFNPMDKIAELYERLLNAEKEKNEMLQEIIRDRH